MTDTKSTVESTSAGLEWNTACIDESLSHGYHITYCLVNSEPGNYDCLNASQTIEISGASVHNYTLTRLIPYSAYKVHIAAKSPIKLGPSSDPLFFTTLESSPSPPQHLKVTQVHANNATLQWEPPVAMNGVLNRYTIFYNSDKVDVLKVGEATDPMKHVLMGLTAYTAYDIRVLACTGASLCSNASNSVKFSTFIGEPSVVQRIEQGGLAITSGRVEWNKPRVPGGILDFYEMQVLRSNNVWRTIYLNSTRCTLITVNECETSIAAVSFRVRAVNVRYSPHGKVRRAVDMADQYHDVSL